MNDFILWLFQQSSPVNRNRAVQEDRPPTQQGPISSCARAFALVRRDTEASEEAQLQRLLPTVSHRAFSRAKESVGFTRAHSN